MKHTYGVVTKNTFARGAYKTR